MTRDKNIFLDEQGIEYPQIHLILRFQTIFWALLACDVEHKPPHPQTKGIFIAQKTQCIWSMFLHENRKPHKRNNNNNHNRVDR